MSSMHPRRWRFVGLGAVALAIAVAGLVIDARSLAAALLVAYAATLSVVLGALALTMIAHLTTATWFGALRERSDAIAGALPALVAVGLVLMPMMPLLYGPARGAGARAVYLETPFFMARALAYWLVWLAIGESLRAASRIEKTHGREHAAHRFRVVSSVGLIVLGLSMTFASFDWMMSLTPDWYSTAYGVYWFAGGVVGALGLLALISPRAPEATQAIGKLLLTFVMFWVYIGFAQYIVIWSGNLPHEVTWYVARTRGAWGIVALVILLAGIGVPFLLLLSSNVRRRAALVSALGALVLAFHYLDMYWVVMPALVPITWWTIVVSAAALVVVVELTIVVGAARAPARARESA